MLMLTALTTLAKMTTKGRTICPPPSRRRRERKISREGKEEGERRDRTDRVRIN